MRLLNSKLNFSSKHKNNNKSSRLKPKDKPLELNTINNYLLLSLPVLPKQLPLLIPFSMPNTNSSMNKKSFKLNKLLNSRNMNSKPDNGNNNNPRDWQREIALETSNSNKKKLRSPQDTLLPVFPHF